MALCSNLYTTNKIIMFDENEDIAFEKYIRYTERKRSDEESDDNNPKQSKSRKVYPSCDPTKTQ